MTSSKIIHHTGSHIVGKNFLKDNLRRFQVKEDEMNAEKLTCDAMHIESMQNRMLYLPR